MAVLITAPFDAPNFPFAAANLSSTLLACKATSHSFRSQFCLLATICLRGLFDDEAVAALDRVSCIPGAASTSVRYRLRARRRTEGFNRTALKAEFRHFCQSVLVCLINQLFTIGTGDFITAECFTVGVPFPRLAFGLETNLTCIVVVGSLGFTGCCCDYLRSRRRASAYALWLAVTSLE